MEDELDSLLSQLDPQELSSHFDIYNDPTHSRESQPRLGLGPSSTNEPLPSPCTSGNRFHTLKTDSEVEEARKKAVPKNTDKNTSWAVNIWKEWSAHRCKVCTSFTKWPTHLLITEPSQLDYWLSKFVLETRKGNGDHYPPDTLYSICSGLLRYIRETRPQMNIFKDPVFAGFQRTLDSEMKRLRALGLGVKKKQAEPIIIEEEDLLWEKGFLGDANPQQLLDTMLFLCGVHFALRSGEEHRSLQLSQFELVCPKDGRAHLIYTENYSKNNQGGLLHRKVKPKAVTCYANESNPNRCLVHYFQNYLKHHPADCSTFYLTPLRKIKGDIWYSKMPVGHNTLSGTVARACKQAGIPGFKTNHSLRVTSATRLFQSGVDEQLIMSHTGHRSVDGVRSYKRVCEDQKKSVSDVLNSASNGHSEAYCVQEKPGSPKKMRLNELPVTSYHHAALSQETMNASSFKPTFNFAGCSSVTINYNIS